MYNALSHSQWVDDAIAALPVCDWCGKPLASGLHNDDTCPFTSECDRCGSPAGQPCTEACLAAYDDGEPA